MKCESLSESRHINGKEVTKVQQADFATISENDRFIKYQIAPYISQ